jgi:hypothetical protein
MATMTPPKHAKAKLNEALRANLRRRKAQMQAREDLDETDEAQAPGVRYSGFAQREVPQADVD